MGVNIAAVKRTLEAERDRLCRQRDAIQGSDSLQSQSEEIGELADYGNHPADTASATYEREKDHTIVASIDTWLQKVERALSKIESGTYGVCDRCSESIPANRLKAMPAATLCLRCQDVEDGI